MRIGIIGAGNMASAVLSGIVSTNKKINICCSDIDEQKLDKIRKTKEVTVTKDNTIVIDESDIVFLCVKPNIIEKVSNQIRPFLNANQIIISVAAGVTLKTLERFLGKDKKIIRIMPNLPCLIRKGVIAIKPNRKCKPRDKKLAEKLISSIGHIVYLNKEGDFDYITALSGSGPAFLAQYLDANLEFAKSKKINVKTAKVLVFETVVGTVEFLKRTNMEIKHFISMVASPGGTTEAGIKILKNKNYHKLVRDSLNAASRKSLIISKNFDSKGKKK